MARADWIRYIRSQAPKYGLDPHAALAVASAEGLSGAVGDAGTSYGPFQLHVGGALPQGRGRAWAESNAGIDYALQQMAQYAKGLKGKAAVASIVRRFERPADPTGEIARAMGVYGTIGGQVADIATGTPSAPGRPPKTLPGFLTQPGAPRTVMQRQWDPGAFSQGIFSALAAGGTPDFGALAQTSFKNVPTLIPGAPKQVAMTTKGLPGGTVPSTAPPNAKVSGTGLVQTAAQQLGQKYVWGGESRAEGGFDCSGLIDWAARKRGYKGPRLTTWNIANMGTSVKGGQLRPGDLVISNGGKHVTIYAGNGKVLASPHTGEVVQWQDIPGNVTDVRRVGL